MQLNKQFSNMPVQYILHHLRTHNITIPIQGGVILITMFGGKLVADVYQLSEIGIIRRRQFIMTQHLCKLRAGPGIYDRLRWQARRVYVYDRSIRSTQLIYASKSLYGKPFRKFQRIHVR